jgi:hypothetical protein
MLTILKLILIGLASVQSRFFHDRFLKPDCVVLTNYQTNPIVEAEFFDPSSPSMKPIIRSIGNDIEFNQTTPLIKSKDLDDNTNIAGKTFRVFARDEGNHDRILPGSNAVKIKNCKTECIVRAPGAVEDQYNQLDLACWNYDRDEL